MRISSITKNAGKACNNRLYRHIRTFEKIVKNYFVICPKLVNKNQGKTKTIEKIWNKKFGRYVPKHWARTSDCEVHIKKVPIQPAWEYHIISIKRL